MGNGDLASIPDKATNDFLITLTTAYTWIGATDADSEGVWRWSDGTPWGYENWNGEPDNAGNKQHYGAINWGRAGLWDDGYVDAFYPFICESMMGKYDNNLYTLKIPMFLIIIPTQQNDHPEYPKKKEHSTYLKEKRRKKNYILD